MAGQRDRCRGTCRILRGLSVCVKNKQEKEYKMKHQKMVSIVTPVFNSMRTLELYLRAIQRQAYPHACMEIIFADGGSTDGTLEKIEEYRKHSDIKVSVCQNLLQTAEAGKAAGARRAQGEILCLLDSDNIIPDKKWMERMVKPFADTDIVASEPIAYTYRKKDNVINRYCALAGMNDPLCLFTGNYDRYCRITNQWTQVPREETDCGGYLSVRFRADMIPTIGANGFFIRADALACHLEGDYLFDIDILWELFRENPALRVAKVKTGIIHLYCQDIRTFYRKQNRRISDYLYFSGKNVRKYPWGKIGKGRIVLFSASCVTVVPLLIQAMLGYSRKRDLGAWLFHLPACWITLWVYGWGTVRGLFKKGAADRSSWKQ